jgi:hypothetical protein
MLFGALSALFLCSCATVVRGTSETAEFESSPSGAAVTTESTSKDKLGPFNCVTPCELELKRKHTWRVDFALEGYKPVSGLLKPVLTGGGLAAGAGNALIGGLIGVGIDAGTGANLDLRPNPMIAELEPIDSPRMSRILDADPVTDVPADAETPNDVAPADAPAPAAAEEVTPDDPAAEDAEPADGAEPDAATTPIAQLPTAPPVANTDAGVTLENARASATGADGRALAASASEDVSDWSTVRIYKPGEPAPDDDVSGDLNRLQLQKARAIASGADDPS